MTCKELARNPFRSILTPFSRGPNAKISEHADPSGLDGRFSVSEHADPLKHADLQFVSEHIDPLNIHKR